jgi:glycosyltransferase involved in cell wall biosynthesis
MRVLVLSYEMPSYPGGGGQSRQHCLLEPLAERHEIRVVTTGTLADFGTPPAGVDIRRIDTPSAPEPPSGRWLRKNLDHYRHGPPWLHYLAGNQWRALAAALGDHIADFRPEVIQVEHGELAPLLRLTPAGTPTVLVMHNMLVSIQRQLVGATTRAKERLTTALEVMVMARQERRDFAAASRVVVVTDSDLRLARRINRSARLSVIPNCIPTEYFRRTTPPASIPTAVMTASFGYPPNQLAARILVERIFPEVRRQVAGAELVLVGQGMPDSLKITIERCQGARAAGAVADVRPELHRAHVSVAPLFQGSGSPLKVIEALASRVPVVTISRVARALQLSQEHGVLVADNADRFADRMVSVLRDHAAFEQHAGHGEETVRRRFDRSSASLMQERVWTDLVAAAHSQGGMRPPPTTASSSCRSL